MSEFLILILVGLAIGVLAGFLGIGGGIVTVPFLLFWNVHLNSHPEFSIKNAVATSLLIAFVSSLTAVLKHRQMVTILPVSRLIFIIVGLLIGGLAGSTTVTELPANELKTIIGILFIGLAVYFPFQHKLASKPLHTINYSQLSAFWVFFIGFLTGLFSTFSGLGGGLIFIPLFMLFFKINGQKIAPISSQVIIYSTFIGIILYGFLLTVPTNLKNIPGYLGYIYIQQGLPLALGALAGGYIGATYVHKSQNKLWLFAFSFLLVMASIHILLP